MIIDLKRFVEEEQPFWRELEAIIDKIEEDPAFKLDLNQLKRFHYLYERAGSGLVKLMTFAAAPDVRSYLENLVARAYGEVHETRDRAGRLAIGTWFRQIFPETFRRNIKAFYLSCAAMLLGCIIGAVMLALDPESKETLLPFQHLAGDPRERVAHEEAQQSETSQRLSGGQAYFSSSLMTHNTRVAITTLSLGMTFGVGTLISLFYNGIILGAVSWDYIMSDQTLFLLGWLLPHGVVEIPAILIAGQGGFLLASSLIGWGTRSTVRERLRSISRDLATLIGGVAVLLVWAGLVEAFLSQYHAPIIPYSIKIAFGLVELLVLIVFLSAAGRRKVEA